MALANCFFTIVWIFMICCLTYPSHHIIAPHQGSDEAGLTFSSFPCYHQTEVVLGQETQPTGLLPSLIQYCCCNHPHTGFLKCALEIKCSIPKLNLNQQTSTFFSFLITTPNKYKSSKYFLPCV